MLFFLADDDDEVDDDGDDVDVIERHFKLISHVFYIEKKQKINTKAEKKLDWKYFTE